MRFLDVADPTAFRQIGYWVTGAQETWGAYWVPECDAAGRQTGNRTDLVYTNDPTRGIEILAFDVPTTMPDETPAVTAPVLDEWLVEDAGCPSAPAARGASPARYRRCKRLPPGAPQRSWRPRPGR